MHAYADPLTLTPPLTPLRSAHPRPHVSSADPLTLTPQLHQGTVAGRIGLQDIQDHAPAEVRHIGLCKAETPTL